MNHHSSLITHRAEGILLVDKAQGWTSHDVIAKVRRICGQRRAGHTGTLDPMATGLLVVCLGQATRLVEYMTGHSKRYTGEITLGVTTDTDDAEGAAGERREVPADLDVRLPAILPGFVGTIAQLPPAYSALKVGGRRAYDLARAGEAPALRPRPVRIDRLTVTVTAADRLAIVVECGAGTYIRSLARDIGAALGCGGHLSALRREQAGPLRVEDAWTVEALAALAGAGRLEEALLPPDEGIAGMPAAILGPAHAGKVRQGLRTRVPGVTEHGPLRVYDADGALVGIGSVKEHALHCSKVLV